MDEVIVSDVVDDEVILPQESDSQEASLSPDTVAPQVDVKPTAEELAILAPPKPKYTAKKRGVEARDLKLPSRSFVRNREYDDDYFSDSVSEENDRNSDSSYYVDDEGEEITNEVTENDGQFDDETPSRTRRKRHRSSSEEYNTYLEDLSDEFQEEEEAATSTRKKRGSGRLKKYSLDEDDSDEYDFLPRRTSSRKKRAPGRPRKNPRQEDESFLEDQSQDLSEQRSPAPSTGEKRKPGRPRKRREYGEEDVNYVPYSGPKRGRGRPRRDGRVHKPKKSNRSSEPKEKSFLPKKKIVGAPTERRTREINVQFKEETSSSESEDQYDSDDPNWGGEPKEEEIDYGNYIREFAVITDGEGWDHIPFMRNCALCQVEFTSKSTFMTHEPCYSTKRKMRELFVNPPTMPYDCEICTTGFDELHQLSSHVAIHFDPIYTCKTCKQTFELEGEIKCHVLRHPTISRKYACSVTPCDRTFTDRNQALDHVARAHKESVISSVKEKRLMKKQFYYRKKNKDGKFRMAPRPLSNVPGELLRSGRPVDLDQFVELRKVRESYDEFYTHSPEVLTNLTCDICKKSYRNLASTFHFAYTHIPCFYIKQKKRVENGKLIPPGQFDCELCDQIFPKLPELEKHVRSHFVFPYKCNLCDYVADFEKRMILHSQDHTGESLLACTFPDCPDSEQRWSDYKYIYSHVRNTHLVKSELRCEVPQCGLRFACVEDRIEHQELEHPKRIFKQPKSTPVNAITDPKRIQMPEFEGTAEEKTLQTNKWLEQFIIRKSRRDAPEVKKGKGYEIIPFYQRCDLCNKVYKNKARFLAHAPCYLVRRSKHLMEAGIDEAPRYQCEFCEHVSPSLWSLQEHMTFHIEPQFKCSYCGKLFKVTDPAREHVRSVHHNWQQYHCNFDRSICQRDFKSAQDCQKHVIQEHVIIKKLKCDLCDFEFRRMAYLKTHIKQVHEKNSMHRCPVDNCQRIYSHERGLNRHLKNHHPTYQKKNRRGMRFSDKMVDVVDGHIAPLIPENTNSVLPGFNDALATAISQISQPGFQPENVNLSDSVEVVTNVTDMPNFQ